MDVILYRRSDVVHTKRDKKQYKTVEAGYPPVQTIINDYKQYHER